MLDTQLGWRDLRDARIENQLAAELRALSEEDAFEHVKRLVRIDEKVGLSLSRRVLRCGGHFEALMREGLMLGNASTIRFWIESTVHTLGVARVVELVSERLNDDPLAVQHALYWLPGYVSDDADVLASIRALQRETNARLPERARGIDPE